MSDPSKWKWTEPDQHGITYPEFGTNCPDCGRPGELRSPSYGPNDPPQYGCYSCGTPRTWRARTRQAFRASDESRAVSHANAEQLAKRQG